MVVLRLLLLLIATGVLVVADENFPTEENLPFIQEAASLALEIYSSDGIEEAMDKGQVTSAAMTVDETDRCLVAFRGADQGFSWIKNIDLRRSKVASLTRPDRFCRVVKQYKWEYAQNRHQKKYRKSVRAFVTGCAEQGKLVVFVGHDFGGALATLWGLAFEELKERKMVITFGQPPVFMPPQYNEGLFNAPGVLGAGPGGKDCRHVDDDSYIPIVNTQEFPFDGVPLPGPEQIFGGIKYDFMYFLNVAVYALIGDSSLTDAVCLTDAATHVEAFIRSATPGNLGSPLGQFLLMPPKNTTEPSRFYRYDVNPRRYRTFRNYIPFHPDFPRFSADLIAYPGAAECEGGGGGIHAMEAYLEKLNAVIAADFLTNGLVVATPCSFSYECFTQTCIAGQCGGEDGRPTRKRKFRK